MFAMEKIWIFKTVIQPNCILCGYWHFGSLPLDLKVKYCCIHYIFHFYLISIQLYNRSRNLYSTIQWRIHFYRGLRRHAFLEAPYMGSNFKLISLPLLHIKYQNLKNVIFSIIIIICSRFFKLKYKWVIS